MQSCNADKGRPLGCQPRPQVRAPRVEELSSVEASLRLDAVASAGFRMSRSKMMDLIKSGALPVGGRHLGAGLLAGL